MELSTLMEMLRQELMKRTDAKTDSEKWKDVNVDEIVHKLTIATLKFADLSSYRKTDYIFNIEKFASVEGKTGPYLLYSR